MVRSFPSRGRQLYETAKDVCNDEHMRKRSGEIQSLLKKEITKEEIVSRIEKLLT
jgi:hypothetical protein